MTRAYGQYCGLARALDLVGARWSMLIVRELLIGPKRFTELEQLLPGIPTNILSSRLREMEDAGLVERALAPRPQSSVVYGLTAYGRELQEPLALLGLWGAKSLGMPKEGDAFSISSLAMALRAMLPPEASQGPDLLVELRSRDQCLNVALRDGQLSFPAEPFTEPHLTLEAPPEVLAALFRGYAAIDAAIAAGHIQVGGPLADARRFFDLFRLPAFDEALL